MSNYFLCNEATFTISDKESLVFVSSDAVIFDQLDEEKLPDSKLNKSNETARSFDKEKDSENEKVDRIKEKNPKTLLSETSSKSEENIKNSKLINSYSFTQNQHESHFLRLVYQKIYVGSKKIEKSHQMIYNAPYLSGFFLKVNFSRPPPHFYFPHNIRLYCISMDWA